MRSHDAFPAPAPIVAAAIFLYWCCFSAHGFVNNIHPSTPVHRSLQLQQNRLADDELARGTKSNPVWVPPSQNVKQRRGNVFSIRNPGDLLDFISEDERLCVVKVYANWCRTCKAFNSRYKKVVSQFGDKYEGTQTIYTGQARFAEMELHGSNAKFLQALLGTEGVALPHILMYSGSNGLVKSFDCAPKNIQILVDAVEELLYPIADDDCGHEHEFNVHLPYTEVTNGDDATYREKTTSHTSGLGATQSYLSTLSRVR